MARHVPLFKRTFWVLLALVVMVAPWARPSAQSGQAPAQKQDAEYTALIKQYLTDPRISTELVDHLPASDKVPTPLKFLGRVTGQPGYLTYAKEIHAYMKAIADAAPRRAKFWVIGQTEEGRDQIVLAVSSEENIKNLDRNKADLQALTDPRRTTEAQARTIIARAKPIYWLTSGVHSTERGGPEMLTELAYRLVVEETPFIQQIRNNVITFITPVVEVDGRERIVDTAYYNAKRQAEGLQGTLGLPYWGKYVAHDNNRDGMGQFLAMTKNVMKVANEWKPTVLHDLHEAQQLLYSSTGTGPYNEQLDPITIGEWWMFAQNDVMEMTKRGVPGVWTYGFYDGWTPNYMFYAVHTHNATGRFYEVGGYGVNNVTPRSSSWRGRGCQRAAAGAGRQVVDVAQRRVLRGGRGGAGCGAGGSWRWRRWRTRSRTEPRVVPSESGSRRRRMGPARAREHEPVGRAVLAELHGQGQGALARELLDQEPERGESRRQWSGERLGHSCGSAQQGQCGGSRGGAAGAGRRGAPRVQRVHRRRHQRESR